MPAETLGTGRCTNRHGVTPLWTVILLGFGGLAVGLAFAYFFSSCPIPSAATSDVTDYLADDDVCGPDIASLAIRPPEIVVPVTAGEELEFEVEALAYRSDGGGIPPDCVLDLKWDDDGPINPVGIPGPGNRATVTIDPDDPVIPGQWEVKAWLADRPQVPPAAAQVVVVEQASLSGDYVVADYDGTVTVALVDGAGGSTQANSSYSCYAAHPVSFVSVGVLPDLGQFCQGSFRGAAVFGAKRGAWFEPLSNHFWHVGGDADEVDATGAATAFKPISVAVWIALDGGLDGNGAISDVGDARKEAADDMVDDLAWANAVYARERVGLYLDGSPAVIQVDAAVSTILDGGPSPDNVDYEALAPTAYDPNSINVYVVNRPWIDGLYKATMKSVFVIAIQWSPLWRQDPSLLAHEVGHALGLVDDLTAADGAPDNLMIGSRSEWKSRLSVGQLFLMNFSASSWATTQPPVPTILPNNLPLWDVGIGK